jgi:hypothetical protein
VKLVSNRLDPNGIPVPVLTGKVLKFKEVHVIYKKVLYETFMAKLHKSFYDRAFYGTDDYGQKWKALHRRTDEIKLEEIEAGKPNPQMTGKFTSKYQFSPSQLKEYKEAYRKILDENKNVKLNRLKSHKQSLNDITLNDLGDRVSFEGERKIPKTPINIRTSRIASAFSPGEVTNNRIYGSKDQNFKLNGLNVEFDIDRIPYAAEVENETKRLFITEKHLEALFEAHDLAIVKAKSLYTKLLTLEERNDRG